MIIVIWLNACFFIAGVKERPKNDFIDPMQSKVSKFLVWILHNMRISRSICSYIHARYSPQLIISNKSSFVIFFKKYIIIKFF